MIPLPIHEQEIQLLYHATIGRGKAKSLALTAANSSEGVSMISYALARRAAAAGLNVLLVDFNTLKPSQGDSLALPRAHWSPDASLEELCQSGAIIPLSNTGLSILTAPADITQYWGFREQSTFKRMIAILQGHYDYVIFDVAPVLVDSKHNGIAAEIICGACEETILITLSGKTKESEVMEAVQHLRQAGANITASLINDHFTPQLVDEICRQVCKFTKIMPRLTAWLQNKIRSSSFLEQKI